MAVMRSNDEQALAHQALAGRPNAGPRLQRVHRSPPAKFVIPTNRLLFLGLTNPVWEPTVNMHTHDSFAEATVMAFNI